MYFRMKYFGDVNNINTDLGQIFNVVGVSLLYTSGKEPLLIRVPGPLSVIILTKSHKTTEV